MKLVAYLRVSTDDKGQDPERQADVLKAWAARRNHEIAAFVTDEGTSGGIPPFSRQKVVEAIEKAEEVEADGLVVEAIDRWTRGGIEELSVSRFFLRLDHELKLVVASTPEGLPAEMEEMWDSMMAMTAKAFRMRLKEQIKSGLDRAKRLGFPNGKPGPKTKPDLEQHELDRMAVMIESGTGLRTCAKELSRMRGAFEVADPKAARRRGVSETWLKARLRKQSPALLLRVAANRDGQSPAVEVEKTRGSEA